MRRLTAGQVERTARDVLGVSVKLEVADEEVLTFRSNVSTSVDTASARGYLDFASEVVASADFSACEGECLEWLLDDVGLRLFRRPLDDAERERYTDLFELGLENGAGDEPEAASWVLEAMLQSPSFLYLDEVSESGGVLDDYSLAARLSLLLWGSNPDLTLLEKAERGELSTPAELEEEALRLLNDPKSEAGIREFVDQWFDLGRLDDADTRPDLAELGAETVSALRAEPVRFFAQLVQEGGDTLILEPLAQHRDRLVVLDGLEMEVGTEYYVPHTYTMPALWTGSPIDTNASLFCRDDHDQCFGWGTGTSIDQFIAERLAPATPFPTLELGYNCNSLHPANRMIYSAPGVTKNPIDDPARAFEQLFGGEVDPDEEARQRQAFRRKSVLDTVLADFNSRRGTLSAADRSRLEAHAESIRELERALTSDALACTRPDAPTEISAETAIDRQSELIAGIFGCGLTRIASFQLRIADNDNSLYPWVGLDEGGHHTMSHESDDAAFATLAQVYRWYSQRFAYLLDRLANTPDVDGTSVLDNTLIAWGSELGTGWTHSLDDVPFILAGGANSGLSGGQYLDVKGAQTTRVLVTALHAMGLTDVESYGTTDKGSGPLDGVLGSS